MTTQTIRTIDGRELYVCEVETLREAVERAVREMAKLAGAELAGANLTGANLGRAYLTGANLADANLAGANLAGANLAGAYLPGAHLTRANLTGPTLIDAGQDSRGYRFVGVPTDGVRILAGCRWFTVTKAREHWSGNPEALAKASLIEAEAARRGWIA